MTTQSTISPSTFPIVKASLTLIVLVAACSALVYALLSMAIGWQTLAKLSVFGAALSIVIGLAGFVPVWLMSRATEHGSAYGFLTSILVRCVVGFLAVIWLRWGANVDNAETLLMCMAGWYMLVLAIEVKLVSSHVLAVAGSAGPMPEAN